MLAAALLLWRSKLPDENPAGAAAEAAADVDRGLARMLGGLVVFGALVIVAGTAATAAGPHAGGSPGQKINRLAFDGHGTMDFVIHRHAEIALIFSIAAVAVWFLARRRDAPERVQRPLTRSLCAACPAGGGGARPVRDAPAGRSWCGSTSRWPAAAWLATIWSACEAGVLARRSRRRERSHGVPRARCGAPRPSSSPEIRGSSEKKPRVLGFRRPR